MLLQEVKNIPAAMANNIKNIFFINNFILKSSHHSSSANRYGSGF
jgi:hypothetical protein